MFNALAPSMRGLSKIYLIFDWGSVVTNIGYSLVSIGHSLRLPARGRHLPQRGRQGIYVNL